MVTAEPLLSIFDEAEKRLAKPFRSPGGKDIWAKWIISNIPKHKIYIEPYAGSASVFFAKDKSDVEILSDKDEAITSFFKFLQTASDADFVWLRAQNWDWGVKRFAQVKNSKPENKRAQIFKFKYINLHSIRGAGTYLDTTDVASGRKDPGKVFLANLEKFRARLKETKIIHGDALDVMRKFDGKETFHYIDPPWKAVGAGEVWRNFDVNAFTDAVKRIKGKALISFQGKLELDDWDSFSKTMAQGGIATDSKQEIYANYGPIKKFEDWPGMDKTITSPDLAGGGRLNPAQGLIGSGIHDPKPIKLPGIIDTTKSSPQELFKQHDLTHINAEEKTRDPDSVQATFGDIVTRHAETVDMLFGKGLVHPPPPDVSGLDAASEKEEQHSAEQPPHFNIDPHLPKKRASKFADALKAESADLLKPFPNEHAARQTDPDKYDKIRRGTLPGAPAGISVIWGVLSDRKSEIQSIRFDKDKFTPAEAKAWLKEHDFKTSLEEATGKKEPPAGHRTAAAWLIEAGPPNEWSGAVAGILGQENRKRVTALWDALKAADKKRALDAWEKNFDAEDVMLELEDAYGDIAKCVIETEDTYPKEVHKFEKRSRFDFPELCGICKAEPAEMDVWFTDQIDNAQSLCLSCLDWASTHEKCMDVPILKLDEEQQVMIGIALEPDEVDAQNDTIKPKTIERTAYNFLADFGKVGGTRLGLMHSKFGDIGLELVSSWIALKDETINGKRVKKGSWLVAVRVTSSALWAKIKSGELTGFSIGGVAAVA